MDYAKTLAEEFKLKTEHCKNIIDLIDGGNTIPFIARYRKEMTGSADDQVLRELNARDEQDMNRKTDPLRQAEDAVLVDSTKMTIAQTVDAIVAIVEEVYGK